MLTNMLNAPVAKLTVGKHIDLCQYFLDSRTLESHQLNPRVEKYRKKAQGNGIAGMKSSDEKKDLDL